MNQDAILSYILNRLKEKSFYVSFGTALTGLGIAINPDAWQSIMSIGMGLGGLLSTLLPARVDEKNVTPSAMPTALSDGLAEKK